MWNQPLLTSSSLSQIISNTWSVLRKATLSISTEVSNLQDRSLRITASSGAALGAGLFPAHSLRWLCPRLLHGELKSKCCLWNWFFLSIFNLNKNNNKDYFSLDWWICGDKGWILPCSHFLLWVTVYIMDQGILSLKSELFFSFATLLVWRRSSDFLFMPQAHGLELNYKKMGCFSRVIIVIFSKLCQHCSETTKGLHDEVLHY